MGKMMTKKQTTRFNLNMPNIDHQWVEDESDSLDISMTDLVNRVISRARITSITLKRKEMNEDKRDMV